MKVKSKMSSFVAVEEKENENKSSDSVIFVSETKNESDSNFADNELSASEASNLSCNSLPPDYMEQLKNLYAGVGSKILKRGKPFASFNSEKIASKLGIYLHYMFFKLNHQKQKMSGTKRWMTISTTGSVKANQKHLLQTTSHPNANSRANVSAMWPKNLNSHN